MTTTRGEHRPAGGRRPKSDISAAWLRARLGIQLGEWARFSLFAVAFFLMAFGIECGRIGRDSFFLKQVGVGPIPLMYVLIAVVMVSSAPVYDRLVRRMPPDRLLAAFQLAGGIGLLLAWAVIVAMPEPPRLVPYALYPLVEAFLLFLLMHFWAFANTAFDASEGRRLFAFVVGAGLLGSLLAGLSSRLVSATIGANQLLGLWAVLLLASVPLAAELGRRVRAHQRRASPGVPVDLAREMAAGQAASFLQVWRQPLLRTLAYMALPMWIIIFIIEYSYFDVTNRVFPDQDTLAGFLGLVVSVSAASGFVLQFTVTPWLLRRLGVGATSIVYPATLTLGAIALLLFTLFPGSAAPSLPLMGIALFVVFARFCDVAFFFSVHDAAQQLLLYAVPRALRDRARVLMFAVIAPASIATAGALLLAFRRLGEPTHNVAFIGITLSFLLMVLALSITPEYLGALIAHMRSDRTDRDEVLEEIAKLPTNDARYVLMHAVTARDLDRARFALERLFLIKDEAMLTDLLETADKIDPRVLTEIVVRMSEEERQAHAPEIRAALAAGSLDG